MTLYIKTYQVPATVFLPTDFIGTNKLFWTDRLTNLFLQKQGAESKEGRAKGTGQRVGSNKVLRESLGNGSLRFNFSKNPIADKLENLKGSKESKLEKAIQVLKAYRDEEIEEILSELSRRWNICPNFPGRAFLTWDEVREMAQSGLIAFGSHTASHRILTTLRDDEIHDELLRSRERLIAERVVDKSFIPFSYPNGNYNEKIARMVKEVGYNLAVTIESGWNHLDSNPFTLRRIGIHQDVTLTEAMFGCRIAGIF